MSARVWVISLLMLVCVIPLLWSPMAPGCCPVSPLGKPVVNADQTVIIVWDAATKTQHFVRKASFKSAAEGFGFLVPTPNQPELEEPGNEAFPFLQKLTEPEVQKVRRPSGGAGCNLACSEDPSRTKSAMPPPVKVLAEKEVAGFNAVVLESSSANELVNWLKINGYAFSLRSKPGPSPTLI